MTLRDVANEAGVSIAYLSDLERAVLANPTLDKLRGIADALRIPIDELLGNPQLAAEGDPPLAGPLRDFAALDAFRLEIEAEAKRWRRDVAEIRDDWIRLLAGLQIAGRRPTSASDYLFIFEAIRRAVEH
jgi:transcriptional regulator with XRE-family HTH domain